MSGDYIKTFKLEVEIQENGIIRDPFGWIIGRCDDDWLKLVTRHEMEPNGLTVSNDGELINWRGENYIRQRSEQAIAATLEDVLREFASKKIRIHHDFKGYSTSADDDVIAKYSAEIRELMGGDAE